MKKTELGDVPNSWGENELTRFFDCARRNQTATFVHSRNEVRALEEIDEIMHIFANNASHISQQFLAPMFILRCHSAFRAASSLVLAGHVAETFVMIRSMLEYAGYGLLIAKDPALETLWVSRHQEQGAPRKISRAFNPTTIRAALDKSDELESKRFDLFYQRSIDFGAHPNSHAVNAGMKVTELKDETTFLVLYLHPGDQAQRHALKSLCQAALCALNVFAHAFPQRAEEFRIKEQVGSVSRTYPL